jgi:acyl-coenzyme A thioesterase PaaI-like protein
MATDSETHNLVNRMGLFMSETPGEELKTTFVRQARRDRLVIGTFTIGKGVIGAVVQVKFTDRVGRLDLCDRLLGKRFVRGRMLSQ